MITEHSAYLSDEERMALAIALSRMGFPPSMVTRMVIIAGRLPAVTVLGAGRKK